MSSDFLGGLGGLMKGLSGIMPQDEPAVKIISLQSDLSNLQKQENELYAEIGKKVFEAEGGASRFPDIAAKLQLAKDNIRAVEEKLRTAQNEMNAKEQAEKEAAAKTTCSECGTRNPDGVKFCQECGAKLGGPQKNLCKNCGAENPAGIRFCGECGTRLVD